MPDLLSSFQTSAKESAIGIVSGGPTAATQLQQIFQENFPNQSLSAIITAFQDENLLTQNTTCEKAVQATLEAADNVMNSLASLEHYIHLTVPKMEDGGNFGVGVQLAAIKVLADSAEKIDKGVEELYKYSSSRADALEKCKLPSQSSTKTSSCTISESTGNDKEKGELKSDSKGHSTEEKTVETTTTSPELALRKRAVSAVDVRYYTKAKSVFQLIITSYLAAIDFMDKNKEKIDKPKGEGGSRGYSGSMY